MHELLPPLGGGGGGGGGGGSLVPSTASNAKTAAERLGTRLGEWAKPAISSSVMKPTVWGIVLRSASCQACVYSGSLFRYCSTILSLTDIKRGLSVIM